MRWINTSRAFGLKSMRMALSRTKKASNAQRISVRKKKAQISSIRFSTSTARKKQTSNCRTLCRRVFKKTKTWRITSLLSTAAISKDGSCQKILLVLTWMLLKQRPTICLSKSSEWIKTFRLKLTSTITTNSTLSSILIKSRFHRQTPISMSGTSTRKK